MIINGKIFNRGLITKKKNINLSFCCLKNVYLPAEVTITQDTRFVQLALDIIRY